MDLTRRVPVDELIRMRVFRYVVGMDSSPVRPWKRGVQVAASIRPLLLPILTSDDGG